MAVDSATGEIGSAGATCLSEEDGAITISDIILGVGAIHTQAWWTVVNQNAAHTRMETGDTPEEIISWLEGNDNSSEGGSISDRQYGVVTLNDGTPLSAAYTGNNNFDEKGHRVGDGYAIQGNILISQDVLDDMENAFLTSDGPLCERLMAVLQAAKRPGADVRCLEDGISSGSAFIRVAKQTDVSSDYGDLWLDINVWLDSGAFTGDPIDEVQNQFDRFKESESTGITELNSNQASVFPNPTNGYVTIDIHSQGYISKLKLSDVNGRTLITKKIRNKQPIQLDLSKYERGLYFVELYVDDVVVVVVVVHKVNLSN